MVDKKDEKSSIITKFLSSMGAENVTEDQFLQKIEKTMDEDPEIVQILKNKQPKNKIN